MPSKEHIIETESALGWLEDGIIHYIFKKSKVDLPEAIEAIDIMTSIANGNTYSYFIDISKVRNITKEAREYFAIPRSTGRNIATAVLAPGIIAKLIGTFLVTFNNPGVKVKLFIDEQEAINWLKKEALLHI
jgi:hypothetical protein